MNLKIGFWSEITIEDAGSLAIIGPGGKKKTQALISVALNNRGAAIHIITRDDSEWYRVGVSGANFIGHSSNDVTTKLSKLSALASQRQYGRECGEDHIILVDMFDYLDTWDYQARLDLEWLIANGARYGVIVVAAVNIESITNGKTSRPSAYSMITSRGFDMTAEACVGLFVPRGQFRVNGTVERYFKV